MKRAACERNISAFFSLLILASWVRSSHAQSETAVPLERPPALWTTQPFDPMNPPPERVVTFDAPMSLGELFVRPWGGDLEHDDHDGEGLGPALGAVRVPAGNELRLKIALAPTDFSALGKLRPDDLQGFEISHASHFTVGDMRYFQGMVTLRSLWLKWLYGIEAADSGMKYLGGLVSLEYLWLEKIKLNTWKSIEPIRALVRLRSAHFYGMQVSDDGLEVLGGLAELRKLSLTNTGITHDGIHHLTRLDKLETLSLQNNQIGDTAGKALSELHSLRTLWLSGTLISHEGGKQLRKSLPKCVIEGLPRYSTTNPNRNRKERIVVPPSDYNEIGKRTIHFPNASLGQLAYAPNGAACARTWDLAGQNDAESDVIIPSGTLVQFEAWGGGPHLDFEDRGLLDAVDLSREEFNDETAPDWTRLQALQSLWIRYRGMSGRGLAGLAELKKLEDLDLDGSRVPDEAMDTIGRIPRLRRLTLDNMQFHDALLDKLAGLEHLTILELNSTALTDNCVEKLEQFKHLERLEIGKTRVTAEAANRLRKALPNCTIVHSELTNP